MPQYLISVPPGPIIYSVTCCLTLILEPNNPRTFALGVGFQTQSQTLSNHIIHQTSSTTKAIFSALLTDSDESESDSAESVCRAKVLVIALDLDSATANESESSQSLLTGKVYKYFTCQPCRLPVSQHPPKPSEHQHLSPSNKLLKQLDGCWNSWSECWASSWLLWLKHWTHYSPLISNCLQ